MKNRILSGLLATTMLFSMLPSTVFATEEITTSGNSTDVPAKVTQDATTFSVTVPTGLPVHVDNDGEVTVATDNKIINNSYGPVEVKSIEVQPKNDWTLVDFSTNFSTKKVGLKQFGFQVNDANVLTDGTCEAEFAVIAGNSQLSFTYNAVVAMQKSALSDEQIASVVFTVGWADSAAEETGPSGYEITPVSELDTWEDESGNVSLVLDDGESADLSAIATYSMEAPTWTSSNPSVLSVSEEGVITAVAPGYAEITYGTSRVNETIGVWVTDEFELTNSDYDLIDYTEGNTELLIPKYVMNNTQLKKITSIAANTFTNHNNITSIELPESIIDIGDNAFDGCTSIENVNYQGSAEQWEEIHIGSSNHDLVNKSDFAVALTGISLNKTSIVLRKGETENLTVSYNPSNTTENKTVIWSSSDESVATVSNGVISPVNLGTAVITAQVGSHKATCNVTVDTTSYEITPVTELDTWEDESGNVSLVLDNGQSADLSAVATYSLETPTWSSSNPSVLSVSDDGVITAIAPGYAEITYGTSRVSETIGVWVPESIQITSFNRFLVGYTGAENEELVIPEYFMRNTKLQKVDSIAKNTFKECNSLTSVTIPDSVTTIGEESFRGCTGLTSVTIPNSVTSIENYAFLGCTELTSIEIPDSVTSIGKRAFYNCTGLTSITIPNSVTSIGSDVFTSTPWLTAKKAENPLVIVGNGILIDGTTCTGDVVIPNSVTNISANAFYECTSLISITIPDGVTNIDTSTFYRCTSLTSVNIPDSVTRIGDTTFAGCSKLNNIIIPDSVTSIDMMAFANCTSLTSVTIPDSVTIIRPGIFLGCTSLTSVNIPDSVTSIEGDPLLMAGAFANCTSLTNITIPNSVTSIGSYTFDGCTSLTSIDIPDGVTSIGSGTFTGCTSLTSIDIPDGVTSIGSADLFCDGAFQNCTSLTTITIPDSVTSIENYAFSGCSKLATVNYTGTQEQWNSITIGDNNNKLISATINYNYKG